MCQPLRCRGRTQQRLNKVHWFLACGCVLNTKPSKTQSTGWPVKRHGDLQMSITVPSTHILLPFMPITLTGSGTHCPICLPHPFFWFQKKIKNQKPKQSLPHGFKELWHTGKSPYELRIPLMVCMWFMQLILIPAVACFILFWEELSLKHWALRTRKS